MPNDRSIYDCPRRLDTHVQIPSSHPFATIAPNPTTNHPPTHPLPGHPGTSFKSIDSWSLNSDRSIGISEKAPFIGISFRLVVLPGKASKANLSRWSVGFRRRSDTRLVVHAARPSAASAAAGLCTQVRHPWQQCLKDNQVSEQQSLIKGIW